MSQQNVVPANPDQIAAFKIGAAMRYKERGVSAKQADALFNAHVEKMAAEMGLVEKKPLSAGAKQAAVLIKQAMAARKA